MIEQISDFFPRLNLEIGFFVGLGVGIFGIYVALLSISRYRKKPTPVLLRLSLAILLWSLAAIFDPIFYTFNQLIPTSSIDLVSLGTLVEFGLTGYANLCLAQFIVHVFREKLYPIWSYILMSLEAVVLPIGLYIFFSPIDIILIYAIHLGASVAIYIWLILESFKLRTRLIQTQSGDKIAIRGIILIALSALFLILTLTWFVIHEFLAMEGLNATSPFIVMGWASAGAGAILLYLGYTLPMRSK